MGHLANLSGLLVFSFYLYNMLEFYHFILARQHVHISAILSFGGKLVLTDRFGKSLPLILMPGNFAIFCFNICPIGLYLLSLLICVL